jgi:serine/threonine protein phosphatase PrpC
MEELEAVCLVEGQKAGSSQDRAATFRRGRVVVAVVADGAGGTSGGAAAATRVVESVKVAVEEAGELLEPRRWSRLLEELSQQLEGQGVGQTTAVVVAADGRTLVGASVGDSAALMIHGADESELTLGQTRKPLLGGGLVEPHVFTRSLQNGDILLLATDGLVKYAPLDRICAVLRSKRLAAEAQTSALIDLVRLPSGELHDDIGLVLLRSPQADQIAPEVAAFVEVAARFCGFVERAVDFDMAARLKRVRDLLLELYEAGSRLPHVEPPQGFDAGASPARPTGWAGFGQLDVYWEVFDPYEDTEPVAGSLEDDVLDVYRDVTRGLALWNTAAPKAAAIWEWRFHFDAHWGEHAIDALRVLHRACARDASAATLR